MPKPTPSDPAGVWQAWVAAGTGDERYERFALVPDPLRAAVASHMRTVKAIEAYHAAKAERRTGSRQSALPEIAEALREVSAEELLPALQRVRARRCVAEKDRKADFCCPLGSTENH
jgi:hypothetical protein